MTDVLQLFFYQGNSTLPYPSDGDRWFGSSKKKVKEDKRELPLTPYVEHMRNLSKVIKPRFSHQKTAFFISENGVFLTIKCKGIRPLMIHNLFDIAKVEYIITQLSQ